MSLDEHVPAVCSWSAALAVENDTAPEPAADTSLAPGHLQLADGPLAADAERMAQQVSPTLIIVSSQLSDVGELSARLARSCEVPVLVSRGTDVSTVAVCTDIEEVSLPVLEASADVAERCGADTVIVHNVLAKSDDKPDAKLKEVRAARLKDLAERYGSDDVDTVLAAEPSSCDAVLSVAEGRDAGLIVVGAQARSRRGRKQETLAARVAARASSDVLIVPLARPTYTVRNAS